MSGEDGWEIIDEYVRYVAPHLADRISRWDGPDNEGAADDDVFAAYRIDEQLAKALERKVWLPSGGSLVIDRTEAMTVIDVNTGKFTGQGGNLEETVTRNNLEAAEEIVRQLRLRDVGGIVVIDFIDMVLESNRELVLRRLLECLARDRTKHQVAEVTSLGLVQMTRKRVGAGLLEAFSQQCECCNGRGVMITLDAPAERPTARRRAPPTGRSRLRPATPRATGTGTARVTAPGTPRPGTATAAAVTAAVTTTATRGAAPTRTTPRPPTLRPTRGPKRPPARPSPTRWGQARRRPALAAAAARPRNEGNGNRRTRRSTSAGTAFATAVLVEDTPALVPVVPKAADAAQASFSPGAAGETAPAEATDPSAPPVRRTRAGLRGGPRHGSHRA